MLNGTPVYNRKSVFTMYSRLSNLLHLHIMSTQFRQCQRLSLTITAAQWWHLIVTCSPGGGSMRMH